MREMLEVSGKGLVRMATGMVGREALGLEASKQPAASRLVPGGHELGTEGCKLST